MSKALLQGFRAFFPIGIPMANGDLGILYIVA